MHNEHMICTEISSGGEISLTFGTGIGLLSHSLLKVVRHEVDLNCIIRCFTKYIKGVSLINCLLSNLLIYPELSDRDRVYQQSLNSYSDGS